MELSSSSLTCLTVTGTCIDIYLLIIIYTCGVGLGLGLERSQFGIFPGNFSMTSQLLNFPHNEM